MATMAAMMQIRSLLGPSAPEPTKKGGMFSKPQTAPRPVGSGLFVAKEPVDRLERSATRPTEPASLPLQAPAISRSNAQSAALAALPAPLSAAFAYVFSVLESAPEGQAQLLELLDAQKLTQPVLERLCDLTQQPRAAGLDGAALTVETVALLAHPDHSVYQGDRSYTCAAANLQRQLADEPATLTELIEGLTRPEGVGHLPTGVPVRRVEGSAEDDRTGRKLTDRLLQAAFMELAGSLHGHYRPATDSFEDGSAAGLQTEEIARLTALAQGEDQLVLCHNSKTTRAVHDIVQNFPAGHSFQCGVSWNKQNHMLLFTKLEDGQAHYFDPQKGQAGTLPLEQFLYKTQFILVPGSRAQGFPLPPEDVAWGRLS